MPQTLSSTAGTDYHDPPITVVIFGSGMTRASHPVPIVDDSNVESLESFAVVLTTAESNVNISDGTAIVTILDDDCKLFLHHSNKEEYWCVGHIQPLIVVHI